MKELTRLRRHLRDGLDPDLCELLDSLDKCFEHLEESEDALKGYNYLDREQLRGYFMACIIELSGTLTGLRDSEVMETIVKDLVTHKGYPDIAGLVENNKPVPAISELGDIEDHPF